MSEGVRYICWNYAVVVVVVVVVVAWLGSSSDFHWGYKSCNRFVLRLLLL